MLVFSYHSTKKSCFAAMHEPIPNRKLNGRSFYKQNYFTVLVSYHKRLLLKWFRINSPNDSLGYKKIIFITMPLHKYHVKSPKYLSRNSQKNV